MAIMENEIALCNKAHEGIAYIENDVCPMCRLMREVEQLEKEVATLRYELERKTDEDD